MSISPPTSRAFEPGTTGWSIADLNDPQIEREWELGAYEIVEGVLTKMPAAYYEGSLSPSRLVRIIDRYLQARGQPGEFAFEVDVVIAARRIARADVIFFTPEDAARQRHANAEGGKQELTYGRILIAPTLIIESISLGHEAHDRQTKRRWYAEKQVPNYWILDAYQHSLECFVLAGGEYKIDQSGRNADELRPILFPGLVIPLSQVWVD